MSLFLSISTAASIGFGFLVSPADDRPETHGGGCLGTGNPALALSQLRCPLSAAMRKAPGARYSAMVAGQVRETGRTPAARKPFSASFYDPPADTEMKPSAVVVAVVSFRREVW